MKAKNEKEKKQLPLKELLKKYSIIGVAGNRSSAKTSLILSELLEIRKEHSNIKIAVLGVNPELQTHLEKNNIQFLYSKMDILDLKMKDTIIFVDEMAMLFDTASKNKQLEKLTRFVDRIEHQNCKLIGGTAREGYFNKFMCSRMVAFIVKEIEYESLVNGTWLKERIKAIGSTSDYRLTAEKNEYFIVTTGDDSITTKHTFKYNKELDTKKDNKKFF
jgi:hypothetical protein